jgi:hypothetical protein
MKTMASDRSQREDFPQPQSYHTVYTRDRQFLRSPPCLLPIRTQYTPLPVSPRVLHLPFLSSSISPLLRSSGLSLNHCSVRLVLAVGRSTLCCFSLFYPFLWSTTSDSNSSSLPTVKKGPTNASIIVQYCQFRLYLVVPALYVPTSLWSRPDCAFPPAALSPFIVTGTSAIGQIDPIESVRTASVGKKK